MTHGHRTGRQEAARKRRRRRQVARLGAIMLGIAIVAATAILIFAGGDEDTPPTVAQLPTPSGDATWTTETFTGGPRLAVDRTVHDEGTVPYEHEVRAAFRLKNVGDEPLTLDEISVNTLEGC
jgi:hypothetical protein